MNNQLFAVRWIIILSVLITGCTSTGTSTKTPTSSKPFEATFTPLLPTDTPTVEPTINGRIVFSSDRNEDTDIYSINPDGSCLTRFTAGGMDDIAPVWSPDGSQIAYEGQSTTEDKGAFIYVMNSDGSNQIQLTNDDFWHQIEPRWSQDGKQIVFVTLHGDGYPALYKSTVDTRMGTFVKDFAGWIATRSNTSSRNWSPDGETIVYIDAGGDSQLISIPAEGGEETILTDEAYYYYDPTFSPDGSQICYVREDPNDPANVVIYISDADGSNAHALNTGTGIDYNPVWSPDGKQIAFVSERDGNPELYLVDADGQNLQRLTNDPAIDDSPSWSPNGQYLAFVSDRDGNKEIYTIDLTSLNLTRLTEDPADDYYPAWSPVGMNLPTLTCYSEPIVTATPTDVPLAAPLVKPALSINAITVSNVENLGELDRISNNQAMQGELQTLAWSTDGKSVAVGTSTNLSLFKYPSLEPIWKIETVTSLNDIEFSPDGQWIAGGTTEGDVNLWKTTDGKLVRSMQGEACLLNAVAFSPRSEILASGCDNTIRIWNVTDSSLVNTLIGHAEINDVMDLVFSPDGKLLASAGEWDGKIILWDVQSWLVDRELISDDFVYNLHFSPDGKILASDMSLGIILWDVLEGSSTRTLLPDEYAFGIDFSPDGKTLSVLRPEESDDTHFLSLLSMENEKPLWSSEVHIGQSLTGGFSPDGSNLLTGSGEDDIVRFWSTKDGSLLDTIDFSHPLNLVFSPVSDLFATGWSDGTIRLWRISEHGSSISDQPVAVLDGLAGDLDVAFSPGYIIDLSFSPDGQFILSSLGGILETQTLVWDISTGQVIKDLSIEGKVFFSPAFSPNGTMLAFLQRFAGGRLWNVSDWTLDQSLRDVHGYDKDIYLTYSPDGKMILDVSEYDVRLLKSSDGRLIRIIDAADIMAAAFSPDSTILATGDKYNNVIQFWQIYDGALLSAFETPSSQGTEGIYKLCYSPSGDLIAVGYADGTIRLWSVPDGNIIKTLDIVSIDLAFSSDGRLLVSIDKNGTIQLWGIKP